MVRTVMKRDPLVRHHHGGQNVVPLHAIKPYEGKRQEFTLARDLDRVSLRHLSKSEFQQALRQLHLLPNLTTLSADIRQSTELHNGTVKELDVQVHSELAVDMAQLESLSLCVFDLTCPILIRAPNLRKVDLHIKAPVPSAAALEQLVTKLPSAEIFHVKADRLGFEPTEECIQRLKLSHPTLIVHFAEASSSCWA